MIDRLSWVRALRADGTRVRRAWPRSAEHLLLDVVDEQGRATAGQWFADPDRAERVRAGTPGARLVGAVVLQPDGGDRRLPAVADLLRQRGHHLVSHRPERRAVVTAPHGFVKVVRTSRLPAMARRARLAESLAVGAPAVLDTDATLGTMTTAPLPGRTLTDLLSCDALPGCRAAGAALARLHRTAIPDRADLGTHGPNDEQAVLDRWTALAQAYGLLDGPRRVREIAPSQRHTLIHRDLHDGQLVIDGAAGVGMLDFDLLTVGDPALDLANLLAHLELRAEQGVLDDVAAATSAVLAGYRPERAIREALPGYLAVSRERLRAVYAFRDPLLVS